MKPDSRIYLAGHRGLVGGAILRVLRARGQQNLILRSSRELDLRDQAATFAFFEAQQPEVVILAAARVGGIGANSNLPGEFIYENLAIASNVIEAARRTGVGKLLNLGSTCIYPRMAPQPIREDALLSGPLEPTNRPYALAKIAAIEMCDAYRRQYGCDFISAMPTNLYGPGDNFDLETCHVLPALLRKFQEAQDSGAAEVMLWGTGTPLREFLYIDDLAEACLFLLERYSEPGPINVGSGEEVSILQLARMIAQVVGFQGSLVWDKSRSDGTPRKICDSQRLYALGFKPQVRLHDGLRRTHAWFLEHRSEARGVRTGA